jgi:hypothetical protein
MPKKGGARRIYILRPGMSLQDIIEANTALDPERGCMLWTGALDWLGYARLANKIVSRLVLEAQGGPLGRLCALHHCDQRRCVNVDRLYRGTAKDNARDRMQRCPTAKEVLARAIKAGHTTAAREKRAAKLRKLPDKIIEIIYESEEPTKVLAGRYRISQRAVQDMRALRTCRAVHLRRISRDKSLVQVSQSSTLAMFTISFGPNGTRSLMVLPPISGSADFPISRRSPPLSVW